jgi:hypothetical protein
MKKKISIKKLTLSKDIVSILNAKQNNLVFGGEDRLTKLCCTAGNANSCQVNDSHNGGRCDSNNC